MSNPHEARINSDFTTANMIVKTYFNIFERAGSDGAYSKVFRYYTQPELKEQFDPEFVREVLESLEKNLPIYGEAGAEVATLYKYL